MYLIYFAEIVFFSTMTHLSHFGTSTNSVSVKIALGALFLSSNETSYKTVWVAEVTFGKLRRFHSSQEVATAIREWLRRRERDFKHDEILKFLPRRDNRINALWDNSDKLLRITLIRFLSLYVVESLNDRKSKVPISGLHKTRNRENRGQDSQYLRAE